MIWFLMGKGDDGGIYDKIDDVDVRNDGIWYWAWDIEQIICWNLIDQIHYPATKSNLDFDQSDNVQSHHT